MIRHKPTVTFHQNAVNCEEQVLLYLFGQIKLTNALRH